MGLAEENVWLHHQLRELSAALADVQASRARGPLLENQDLRRRVYAVTALIVRFESEPLGPKSILAKSIGARSKKAGGQRRISFNPQLEIGPSSAAASAALMRMRSAWKA